MAMAQDGSGVTAVATFGGSGSTALPGLTTSIAGDVIFVFSFNRAGHVNSIDGSTLGTGAFVQVAASAAPVFEIWACIAPAALSSEVITVNHSSNFDHGFAAWAVSGSNQSSLGSAFETAVSSESAASLPGSFTTVNAKAMVMAGSAFSFGVTPSTFGTGFSGLALSPLASTWGKTLAATSTETITTDQNGLCNGYLVTALIEAAGGAAPFLPDDRPQRAAPIMAQ